MKKNGCNCKDGCFLFGSDCAQKVGCGEPSRRVETRIIYTKKEKPGMCELYYLGCPKAHTLCCTDTQFFYCKHRPEVQKGYGTPEARFELQDHLKPPRPIVILSYAGIMAAAERLEEKMKADQKKSNGQQCANSATRAAIAV